MTTIAEAERAQARFRREFARLPGIRAIGVTWNDRGEARIRVNVDADAASGSQVPAEFEGVAIEVRRVRGMRQFRRSP